MHIPVLVLVVGALSLITCSFAVGVLVAVNENNKAFIRGYSKGYESAKSLFDKSKVINPYRRPSVLDIGKDPADDLRDEAIHWPLKENAYETQTGVIRRNSKS